MPFGGPFETDECSERRERERERERGRERESMTTWWWYMLGITHLFPHNELVHLPYIAIATNTKAD